MPPASEVDGPVIVDNDGAIRSAVADSRRPVPVRAAEVTVEPSLTGARSDAPHRLRAAIVARGDVGEGALAEAVVWRGDVTQGRTVAGVSDVTSIDAPEVDRIGDVVLDVAGRMERLAGGIRAWQYSAHDAVDGAEMCYSAMSYSAGAWLHTLEDLAAEVREFGGGLRRSAADYRQADAGAAGRVREAGS